MKFQGIMWRLVLTVSLLCWRSEGRVTCRNITSGEVDWFILYKEPNITKNRTGLRYVYIDSTTKLPATVYENIKDPEGVLANTLQPLFTSMVRVVGPSSNFGFISYSDQPPGSNAGSDYGHSKGVVMVEKDKTGVWLLHSTPQFPFSRNTKTFWPDSGAKNAQMFICVTFPYKEFEQIGKHLQYIRAFPFDSQVPGNFHPELRDAADKVQSPPPKTFQELRSEKGQIFRSFAKQQSDEPGVGDLYVTIAKGLGSDLHVQHWSCQNDRSYCGFDQKVLNIKNIETPLGTWGTCDHSKWCVATNPSTPWSCVADMNRAKTQYQRRGGALCIKNEQVQKRFLKFVVGIEDCSTTERKRKISSSESECFLLEKREKFGLGFVPFLNRAHLAGSDSEVRFFSVLFSVVLIYLFQS
ncbi:deoxyribonuclease-2-alpha-like [Micropterus salmoides]|uniref:deoxyribonuclease-2-alpha-like n=1 Tax=Micropterus salmoides TaxID=27706 RepID=UPI0018EB72E5|nr:deoxyribonuclease-2-alpha-like [Micropterus salmoides]